MKVQYLFPFNFMVLLWYDVESSTATIRVNRSKGE